ncbi:DUF599 domain-containing protein [Saccharospirillum alexandrii]|uniref:DUF599 domain-containing protein n=1 Tax=Saccharospirillum alexandrii TaxID=2448477 RepID=UPI000FDC678A|nr:DUF599 domain-containing protein [Saccharospirillum alexandrii]
MLHLFDWLALLVFFTSWVVYTRYASREAKRRHSLSSIMHHFRVDWMHRLLRRENRVADMSAVGNLERNSAFFASSCLFVVAGLITVLAASEQVVRLLNDISFVQPGTKALWEAKVGVLVAIYVYAFLSFTWSMRQFGFLSVMIGSAPTPSETIADSVKKDFSVHTAKVMDLAGKQFNLGLRAVYFSLAVIGWFLGPLWFVVLTSVIIGVLYRREFRSTTLKELVRARGLDPKQDIAPGRKVEE